MASAILNEIKNPSSAAGLVQALKAVKSQIIGHKHRKEFWVRRGIIPHLRRILDTHKTSAKTRSREATDHGARQQISDDEEARLQAIIIIDSLAYGGPALVTPLRIGRIYQPLLEIVSPAESSPLMVWHALSCFNTIADSVALEDIDDHTEAEEFLIALYTDHTLASLNQILNQESSDPLIQEQITLTADLIAKTSNTEWRRKHIEISGIFKSLAIRLATFVVASASAEPGQSTVRTSVIHPAHPRAKLAPILHAICSIIFDSKIRTSNFCCSSVWLDVFPAHDRDIYSWRVPAVDSARSGSDSNLNALSGPTSSPTVKNTSNHPPLHLGSGAKRHSKTKSIGGIETTTLEGFTARDDDDTPLVGWLMDVARDRTGKTRLMAIWFLGLLFRSQTISVRRQRSISMRIIPVLVDMLDNPSAAFEEGEYPNPTVKIARTQLVKALAPKVLSLFVSDNEFLQKRAADVDAIKKLSQLLKQSFDPISPSLTQPMWRPHDAEEDSFDIDPAESSIPGREGVYPCIHHTIQVRDSYLTAIGAMATLNNVNRQAVIDNGVVPFVIESLKPGGSSQSQSDSSESIKPANSVSTLIAACGAAKTLSRSVAVLRTSLVDAGLAKPIYNLLKHSNPKVQIAATEAVSNIVLPFSAMRQDIAAAGVLHILCEHAHSLDPKLRISALWALAHFVVDASNELKIQVIRELGPGWLKHVICIGTGDESSLRSFHNGGDFGLTAANASGEQVDILNSMHNGSLGSQLQRDNGMDINMDGNAETPEYPGHAVNPNRQTLERYSIASDEYFDARVDERTADIQGARDDLAVQEQGINVIRNLLVGGSDVSEIVDFLFSELGQDELFDILTNLLRPKNMDGFRGQDRRSGAPAPKLVPPPSEIVEGVCYILVHIAASGARHKQIILEQTDLLRLTLPLFTHPHPQIRVALIWLVINLTWTEDKSERGAAMNRAKEMKKLGILNKVQDAASDPDLDVRERAKHAMVSLEDLMKG